MKRSIAPYINDNLRLGSIPATPFRVRQGHCIIVQSDLYNYAGSTFLDGDKHLIRRVTYWLGLSYVLFCLQGLSKVVYQRNGYAPSRAWFIDKTK